MFILTSCRGIFRKSLSYFPTKKGSFDLAKVRSMATDGYSFETLAVTQPRPYVFQVEMNRPEKRNAMNRAFWREMVECFDGLSADSDCRCVVLSGAGKIFTAGLDLMDSADVLSSGNDEDPSRRAMNLRKTIASYQYSFTVIEKCTKPVIAAIHSACVGAGIDMTSACDIRLCTQDAWFQIKEVDLGLAADVGTLQRFPRVIGNDSLARELAYTARKFDANEAKEMGYVSHIYPDKKKMMEASMQLAEEIAGKSPVAIQGSKHNLVYSRDHPVDESLNYMVTWNMSMLQTEDLLKAMQASMNKEKPEFSKL